MRSGLTEYELLTLFDECEAHPLIRAAIRQTLRPAEAPPAILLRDTPEDVERLAAALDADLHGYRILQSERKEWARAIVEALRRDSAES